MRMMRHEADLAATQPSVPVERFAGDVERVGMVLVNAYMIGPPGGRWVLVDTGLPHSAAFLRRVAEHRYGRGARPEAIILTHGHFDHAGSALQLARHWNVPIYAHWLEMPYLTGRSDYPPQDPTIGGAMSMVERVSPNHGYDLRGYLRQLPTGGVVPGLPSWRWLHTPGHTSGHVSLFRESDRLLIAGDALTTMNVYSWSAMLTGRREVRRPPAPFTPDWPAARQSVRKLADLNPAIIAAGHGLPMAGPAALMELKRLAATDFTPAFGRYVHRPAATNETGVVAVPPPADDPLPRQAAAAAAAFAFGTLAYTLMRRRRK